MKTKLPTGWFHEGDIKLYRSLVELIPDNGSLLELGVWKGRSLCSIADIIIRKNIKVTVVDTFKGSENEPEEHEEAKRIDLKQVFIKNITSFGLKAKIYAMTTDEAALKIKDKFDLVLIDCDHRFEFVNNDIKNYLPKCKRIIAGHDYELDEVKKAVHLNLTNVCKLHCVQDEGRGTMWYKDLRIKETMKKIDVIIPAFEAQNTIIRTLSSIAMQSIVNDITVTIVNDADGDYSKFVKMFKDFMDIKEIKLEVNGGPGVARQYGIDNTTSPYFTCIDADDTFGNAFSLEILLKGMESSKEFHTVVGSFVEQHENLNFIKHDNDMIWMFGKLYTRSFCNKYNVRFNDTRANEDNGFNTIIRLVSSEQEKIMFLPDIVYYWHDKPDSITRKNNAEYSYNGSFPGYTDNMIYAIQTAKRHKPFNNYIDMWAIQIMAQLYIYYYQTVKRDPRFVEQNYSYCVKYYKEVFKDFYEKMPLENFNEIFGETIFEQAPNMKDVVPELTIHQFIDKLKGEL